MRLSFLILKLLFLTSQLPAQDCPWDYYPTSQGEIDSFPLLYPNCHEIMGNLVLESNDITNVDSLIQVTRVNGTLRVTRCDSLDSLKGLKSIKYIRNTLEIRGNNLLTSLQGLNNLDSIGGSLRIVSNEH